MRTPIKLGAALALAVLALAGQAQAQSGFDRIGSDYLSFQVPLSRRHITMWPSG